MNKKIILGIGFCLLVSLTGLVITTINPSIPWGYKMTDLGLVLAEFSGLVLVIMNGTIFKTLYWKIIMAFLAIIILGALLKILHYPYADLSLFVGSLGVGLTYVVRFITKKGKGHLDFFKLLWVLCAYLGGALMILHIVSTDFAYVVEGVFWILLLDFAWLYFRTSSAK